MDEALRGRGAPIMIFDENFLGMGIAFPGAELMSTGTNCKGTSEVADLNTMVVGTGPAFASAYAYMTQFQAATMASYNFVHAQQQAYITAQTATVAGVLKIFY